ncbi:FCD domain-containing protein [Kitasatospora sp. NPDC056181]|uniref:FCD domain-containing protein n=1 Tax=Kitasatospora sp. NPDC056181 TaxID=3345737 RepID=UPI0035E2E0DB
MFGIDNDLEIHRRLAAGSGNAVRCSLIEGVSGPAARVRLWRGRTEEGSVGRTGQQHRAIHEAAAARQPDLARAWATVHVGEVERWLRGTLGAAASEPD